LLTSLVGVVDERGDDELVDGLVKLLDSISGHAENLRDLVGQAKSPKLQRFLLERLSSSVRGREDEIAALLANADLPTALALVRSLQGTDTPEARRALEVAAEHPDPLVRLEALRGASPDVLEKHRNALRALVESVDSDVRRSTLATVREHSIRAAGPLIAMRAKSAEFDSLPSSEKADVLETLAVLLPSRAEALCVELVQVPGLVSSPGSDDTRIVAAQILAKIATSNDVADVLEAESKRFLRNSVRVRQAVADAARTVRSSIPPPARKGRA
jgi:ATP phosphoribosyltransferase regulatory subunit HisZ